MLTCAICSTTSALLMFTVAGSKRAGTQNETVCGGCYRKWLRDEVELRVRKEGE